MGIILTLIFNPYLAYKHKFTLYKKVTTFQSFDETLKSGHSFSRSLKV